MKQLLSNNGATLARRKKITDMNSPEFHELRQKWYDKLKEKGFDDLEWVGPNGEDSGLLRTKAIAHLAIKIREGRSIQSYHFYSVLRNFCTHNPAWTGGTEAWKMTVGKLYSEGVSFRKMIKLQEQGKLNITSKRLTLPVIHEAVKEFVEKAFKWNNANLGPDGLGVEIGSLETSPHVACLNEQQEKPDDE